MTGIGCHRGRLSQGEAVTEGSYDRESLPQGEAVAGGGCHRGKL